MIAAAPTSTANHVAILFVSQHNILVPAPEATILLVSTKNQDLWPVPTPEVRESRTFLPEVSILGADQKDRGLWGRECCQMR